jgi:mono/diheme cytochrome c family protein
MTGPTKNHTRILVLLVPAMIVAVFALVSHSFTNLVDAQQSGAAVYSQNCARCHGSDGRAQTPKGRQVQATDLTSSDWDPDTARDTRIVTKGKGSMPSFKGKLRPAEISAVLDYIRRFKR